MVFPVRPLPKHEATVEVAESSVEVKMDLMCLLKEQAPLGEDHSLSCVAVSSGCRKLHSDIRILRTRCVLRLPLRPHVPLMDRHHYRANSMSQLNHAEQKPSIYDTIYGVQKLQKLCYIYQRLSVLPDCCTTVRSALQAID